VARLTGVSIWQYVLIYLAAVNGKKPQFSANNHNLLRVYCGEVGVLSRVILLHNYYYQEYSVTFTWGQGVPAFTLP
jgi:hypothetical protein